MASSPSRSKEAQCTGDLDQNVGLLARRRQTGENPQGFCTGWFLQVLQVAKVSKNDLWIEDDY